MHHRGARSLDDAEYEIGETSRLLWKLYPDQSRLRVFASGGGGKKWGGTYWRHAAREYKDLIDKYHLIDLYDGTHPGKSLRSEMTAGDLLGFVGEALRNGGHAPFIFHKIGNPGLIDRAKALVRGYDLTWATERFMEFLDGLDKLRGRVWIAPLLRILKYEAEYKGAGLAQVERSGRLARFRLSVETAPALYDQALTVVIRKEKFGGIEKVLQDKERIEPVSETSEDLLVNVRPINSYILVYSKE
jgi:hypothetical protein